MSVFRIFEAEIAKAVAALAAEGALPAGLDTKNIVVEPPRDPSHGDLATNAAMVLAKPAGKKPREIADQLVAKLKADPRVTDADVAGPGFINLRLDPAVWQAELRSAIQLHGRYGDSTIGEGAPVNVEYVSANPTGPMHVGHCRGAVLGDAMANMLAKVGFKVAREYYINDAGGQIEVLARSTHLRYREALGETITIPEGLYPGDYLKPVGEALARTDGTKWRDAPEGEWLPAMKAAAVDAMMGLIRDDLAALGIRHDVFFSERMLHQSGAIAAAIADLEKKGLIYIGTLEPPKGQKPDDWEERPQTLFRATQFGDDVDRPLKKSDGSFTYFAADIAYHRDKYLRGFARMIDVLGTDHAGYIKRVKAAVAALTDRQGELDVKTCNLVKLLRAGEPVKMSKRSGDFVTLRDVVDEVGKDVVRFIMLTQKPESALDFDFAKVTEQSKDNPVFYVQYAHARIRSVLRRAATEAPGVPTDAPSLAKANLTHLTHPAQAALMKIVAQWPRVAEGAALAHEPHRIAYFLYDVASAFHALWNQGTEAPELRFLSGGDPEITKARLALIQGVAAVLTSGLEVLGVEPVEEMRG